MVPTIFTLILPAERESNADIRVRKEIQMPYKTIEQEEFIFKEVAGFNTVWVVCEFVAYNLSSEKLLVELYPDSECYWYRDNLDFARLPDLIAALEKAGWQQV